MNFCLRGLVLWFAWVRMILLADSICLPFWGLDHLFQYPVQLILNVADLMTPSGSSVWPSVWGWKAILKSRRVPNTFWSLRQNADVKHNSRFNTIDTETLCSLTIFFTNSWAQLSTVYVVFSSRKCTDLVNLLTITQIIV